MAIPQPKSAWLMLAVASGACAAFNGVFAKLTTTTLTTTWSHAVSGAFGLSPDNQFFEYCFRGLFFLLNLLFNAIMWGLFTRALTQASSTVRVSVINTSANFMLTALLGALLFGERLPGRWWVGAALLVAGSVIIGRREELVKEGDAGTAGPEPTVVLGSRREGGREEGGLERYVDEPESVPGEDAAAPPKARKRDSEDEVELRTVREGEVEGEENPWK